MKIAFISTILDYPWGGADTLWTRAAEEAIERGNDLLLSVSPSVATYPRVAALCRSGAKLHERPQPLRAASLGARLSGKMRRLAGHGRDGLVVVMESFKPDLVIISLGGTYDLIHHAEWVDWLKKTSTPFRLIANWQAENPVLTETERAIARHLLTTAERIFFVSRRNMEATRRHLLEPLLHAQVIQNPLRWHPSDVAPWPDAPLNAQLAVVSRLDESKGIQLLLHALAAQSATTNWRLNIYGRGPAEAYLRLTAEHLQLHSNTCFRGYVKDLRPIWAENQLLVSPSIEDGVPMTIPEAMLCERPVLSTDVGGASDWIRHGETGYICPAPTLRLLTEALSTALTSRDRWPQMGRAGADIAGAKYRPKDYLQVLG